MIWSKVLSTATILATVVFCAAANASFTLNITQQGSNVVAAGTGTLDLAGLSLSYNAMSSEDQLYPVGAQVLTGAPAMIDVYSGIAGSFSFGSGTLATYTSTGSGDVVGLDGADSLLAVPSGYVSGRALSSSATWDNATFASLGLTPGTYVYSWDNNGVLSDTFTINISSAPEPASIALLLGLGAFAGLGARRKVSRRA